MWGNKTALTGIKLARRRLNLRGGEGGKRHGTTRFWCCKWSRVIMQGHNPGQAELTSQRDEQVRKKRKKKKRNGINMLV